MVEWLGVYSDIEPPQLMVNHARRQKLLEKFDGIGREEIAATVQAMAEEHVIAILTKARELGWTSDSICLAGGLFANVKINQRVKEFGFKNIFIAPPMTDDGTALGAALAVAAENPSFAPQPCKNMFLGPAYSSAEIEESLKRFKLKYTRADKPAQTLADELAKGAVIGVFQGAMEFRAARPRQSLHAQRSEASLHQ